MRRLKEQDLSQLQKYQRRVKQQKKVSLATKKIQLDEMKH